MDPLLPLIEAFTEMANQAWVIQTAMVAFGAVKLGQMFIGLRGILRLLTMSVIFLFLFRYKYNTFLFFSSLLHHLHQMLLQLEEC